MVSVYLNFKCTERLNDMKKNYMTEKCFREIDQRVQKEVMLDPQKRKMYIKQQEKNRYLENLSKIVRKDMHMYG